MCAHLFVKGRVPQEEEAEQARGAVPRGVGTDLVSQDRHLQPRALPEQLQRCGHSWWRENIAFCIINQ